MSIIGIGQDLIELDRIRQALDRHGARFLERVFTEYERHYCSRLDDPVPELAARFAAKEAASKALGTGIARGIAWRDIEVQRRPGCRPTLHFYRLARERARSLGATHAHITMTHAREITSVVVILEGNIAPNLELD